METARSELPNDVATLKKLVAEHARRAHELEAASKRLQEENAEPRLKLLVAEDKYAVLRRRFFGSTSEKGRKEEENPKQALLFNEAETYAEEAPKPEKKTLVNAHERKARGRRPLPANLERRQIVHELSEEERTCPSCGAVRPEIGQEIREELEFIPARFVVNEHILKNTVRARAKTAGTRSSRQKRPRSSFPAQAFRTIPLPYFLRQSTAMPSPSTGWKGFSRAGG
jgi:hypothetical protein